MENVQNMKTNLVIIFGPPAVGKMTVGYELAKITGYKVMHNHLSIELAREFFDFGHPSQLSISEKIRKILFTEISKSDLPGLIFTFVWGFDFDSEEKYVDRIARIFTKQGGEVHYVELEADLVTRLARNTTPFRLSKKASKQNKQSSRKNMIKLEKKHRMNSNPGEFKHTPYLRINTTKLSAKKSAELIRESFKL